MNLKEGYDYVVIGGGSAGCVVAGRLASRGAEVLVLEAGGTDRRPDVVIPAGLINVYRSCNWRYVPEPDPSRDGAVEAWPAGRILGGGGSINATVFVRGNPLDFDHWANSGATGWEYRSVLPYFKQMESWEGGESALRGGSGPIHVGVHRNHHLANEAFHEAAIEAGHPANPDYNGERQDGVGAIQVNQRRGLRSHSPKGYLRGLPTGHRLTVRTGAVVQRLLFQGSRVSSVEYLHRGRVQTVGVSEEVVLSAGSIASPKILMVSGIGPSETLREHGIPVVSELSEVGSNLQEHAAVQLRWLSTVPTLNRITPRVALGAALSFIRDGSGPLGATVCHEQIMHRTNSASDRPNIQLTFANFAVGRERGPDGMLRVEPTPEMGFMVAAILVRPRIRGGIFLRSSSPADAPIIRHHLLADASDLSDLLDGMEEARRIMSQSAMAGLTKGMYSPEVDCHDPQDWIALARQNATFGAHPVGTCRMGSDAEAVVDPLLRVNGIDRLRIVDASVMPTITTGNTNAPTMMIGEMGADFLLARHQRTESPQVVKAQSPNQLPPTHAPANG